MCFMMYMSRPAGTDGKKSPPRAEARSVTPLAREKIFISPVMPAGSKDFDGEIVSSEAEESDKNRASRKKVGARVRPPNGGNLLGSAIRGDTSQNLFQIVR